VTHGGDERRERRPGLSRGDLRHPEPHDRRDERQRRQVRADAGERERAEVVRQQRRGGHRRSQRDRRALGKGPRHAAERAPDRPGEKQHAGHRGERQLPSGIARSQWVDRQRGRRREQQRIPARARPPGRGGGEPRHGHHPGPLKRRARAGKRHVERHERQQRCDPHARTGTRRAEQRRREREQEHDVLPTHRQDVSEARAPEVVADPVVDRLVLAEHHPAQDGRAESHLAAPPDRVDEP
jgi:hypothetical protein